MKLEELLKNKFLYKKNRNIFKYLYFYYYKFIHKFDVNKSYSFNGIDLLINYLFKSLNDGIYVDVGCFHPVKGNNTFKLFKSLSCSVEESSWTVMEPKSIITGILSRTMMFPK